MATIPECILYIQPLNTDWYKNKVSAIDILRLDVVHKHVSGNKWYKLKENVQHCLDNNIDTLITFGGGYSNHLAATAVAAEYFGLKCIGIVRGDYSGDRMTDTLRHCIGYGMELTFVSYEEYKLKDDREWLNTLTDKYPNSFIVPEGGANELGRLGIAAIAEYISDTYTHIAVSVGTGTTLVGLVNALPEYQKVYGYVPMKGGSYLEEELNVLVNGEKCFQLFDDWHFGGFGKHTDDLVQFMNEFYSLNDIPLDIVYTAKMMYGIQKQLDANIFDKDSKLLCIHTGGLQGNSTIANKLIY
ncbi:MAG: pyridoxal-phosphate dependent enzyme [Chitinophagaceae bacterium]|nr:pyridoxal-phosphate dependent enzyme [Chitinophagaceae bacterium]